MLIVTRQEFDFEHILRDLSDTEKWEMLDILWDELEDCGTTEDWKSFFEEYGLIREDTKGKDNG